MNRTIALFATALILLVAAFGSEPSKSSTKPRVEATWFEFVDGTFARAEYIDLNAKTGERLFVRYGPISDSGVELELVIQSKTIWRVHVQPLGVEHSKYVHEVFFGVDMFDRTKLNVTSIGARTIRETRSLIDGKELSRQVTDNQK
jgi:hypothetical protein